MIEACIFDLDGVIVDTAKFHFLSWQKLADDLGHKLTEDIESELRGISRRNSLDIVLETLGIQISEKEKVLFAEKKNQWFLQSIQSMGPGDALPGIIDTLNILENNGIKRAIGSASQNADTIIDLLKLRDYFDAIVDGTMVKNSKPDPEVFQKAAHMMTVIPSQTVVVEDSPKGIQAALDGGFRTIGIGEPALLSQAEIVIPGFADHHILNLFEQLDEIGEQ